MAVTLDPTVGGAATNTYATLLEAKSYFEAHTHGVVWTEAFPDDQSKALVRAFRELNLLEYVGQVVSETQAGAWPRYDARLRNGFYAASDAIPLDIKDAQCEMAMEFLRDEISDPFAADETVNLTSLSAGGVSMTFNHQRGQIGPLLYPAVAARVKPYLSNSGQGRTLRV